MGNQTWLIMFLWWNSCKTTPILLRSIEGFLRTVSKFLATEVMFFLIKIWKTEDQITQWFITELIKTIKKRSLTKLSHNHILTRLLLITRAQACLKEAQFLTKTFQVRFTIKTQAYLDLWSLLLKQTETYKGKSHKFMMHSTF